MKNIRFLVYNLYSESAKLLREDIREYYDGIGEDRSVTRHSLDLNGLKTCNKYKKSLIVCWGKAKFNHYDALEHEARNVSKVLNTTAGAYTNKKTFLESFESPYTVAYTTSFEKALLWLREGQTIVARTKLDDHSGNGIVLVTNPDNLVEAPLYTLYTKKAAEYRVHINAIDDTMIFQQKKKKLDAPVHDETFKIRNLKNGWVYTRENIQVPGVVKSAVQYFKSQNQFRYIDFCALDIIYNQSTDSAYILEMNLAPGLAGQTIRDYTLMIDKFYKKYL